MKDRDIYCAALSSDGSKHLERYEDARGYSFIRLRKSMIPVWGTLVGWMSCDRISPEMQEALKRQVVQWAALYDAEMAVYEAKEAAKLDTAIREMLEAERVKVSK